jgi:hypothetical protein
MIKRSQRKDKISSGTKNLLTNGLCERVLARSLRKRGWPKSKLSLLEIDSGSSSGYTADFMDDVSKATPRG